MASRADTQTASAPTTVLPRLGTVLRAALTDYYFNSMRLVAANVIWGAGVILVVVVGLVWPVGGLLLLPFLALPTAAIFRVAGRIVRGGPDATRRDLAWPYRYLAVPLILLGSAFVGCALVLGTNLVVGLGHDQPYAWALATLAAWGLVAVWCIALVGWPLIADPAAAADPLRERLRLAGRLLLLHPVRFGALAIAVAVIVTISTVLMAAILTVSVSFVALVACRSVYPAADRLAIAPKGEGT